MALFFAFCIVLLAQRFAIALVTAMEFLAPARRASNGAMGNLGVGTLLLASTAFGPELLAPLTTLAVNAVGGGLIVLPHTGWGIIFGAAVYFFAMDLGEYVFHRAQHAVPFLWSMHSLHHSDAEFSASTTVRHFWADPLMKAVTIWLAVSLLFKASPLIVGIYGAIGYYNFLTHANLRLNFGKASWLLTSPAYHRLHHSAQPEHFDINFAALLPIFDVILGSYRRPGDDEYPETGLDTGAKPRSFVETVIWPLRDAKIFASRDRAPVKSVS